jgi:hypothetical protein
MWIWALALACQSAAEDTQSSGDDGVVYGAAPIPEVVIISPSEGDELEGPDIEIRAELVDFSLEEPADEDSGAWLAPRPLPLWAIGSAHAHGDPNAPAGYILCTIDGEEALEMTVKTFVLPGLSEGEHTVELALHWVDGDALYPPATDSVTFTVVSER